jgi:anti-sigma B factor antagonist
MTIKANILRDALGNITVQMRGDLEYSNSIPLKLKLKELLGKNPHSKVTVDLGGIDFVGSSGICHFVESIHLLNKDSISKKRIGISNVSDDFKKIFRLYSKEEAQMIWDEFDMDDDTTSNMNAFSGRSRTFEN